MIFLYSKWMALPLSTKALLSTQFGFAKTSPTHVSDNRVVQDGYKIVDVENAMNIEAIRKYVGENIADYNALWDAMIAKVEGKTLNVGVVPIPEVSAKETITAAIAVGASSPMAQTVAIEDEPEEVPEDIKERAVDKASFVPFKGKKQNIIKPAKAKRGRPPRRLM